jgi:hypothetical protein
LLWFTKASKVDLSIPMHKRCVTLDVCVRRLN